MYSFICQNHKNKKHGPLSVTENKSLCELLTRFIPRQDASGGATGNLTKGIPVDTREVPGDTRGIRRANPGGTRVLPGGYPGATRGIAGEHLGYVWVTSGKAVKYCGE